MTSPEYPRWSQQQVEPSLPDFLLARLDETEEAARRVPVQHCNYVDDRGAIVEVLNPPRVLADCEAKRRIVELDNVDQADDYQGERAAAMWQVLALLALPYADHPDYREEEWRP